MKRVIILTLAFAVLLTGRVYAQNEIQEEITVPFPITSCEDVKKAIEEDQVFVEVTYELPVITTVRDHLEDTMRSV